MKICLNDRAAPSTVGEVPDGFDDWYAKATHMEPAQRFQTAKELALALSEVADGHGPDSIRLAAAAMENSRLTKSDDYGVQASQQTGGIKILGTSASSHHVTTGSPNSLDVVVARGASQRRLVPIVAGLGITAVLGIVGLVALSTSSEDAQTEPASAATPGVTHETPEPTKPPSGAEAAAKVAEPAPAEKTVAEPALAIAPTPAASSAAPKPAPATAASAGKATATSLKPGNQPAPLPKAAPMPKPATAPADPFATRKIGGKL
jgi:hypothetical protein